MTPNPAAGPTDIGQDYEQKFGFHDPEHYVFKSAKGLTRDIVERISEMKHEPDWMRAFRLGALDRFLKKPMPTWANTDLLGQIRFDNIHYFLKATDKSSGNWADVPDDIRKTYEKLGIPEAERKFLAGVSAQYECLTGDTVVFANPKATPIKDLSPGDHVYSLNETTKRLEKHRVNAVVYKGERPVFEVKAGTRRIKCTANHPLYVLAYQKAPGRQRGRFHAEWRYLSDLKSGDYIAVVKELPDDGRPMPIAAPQVTSEYLGRNQFRTFTVKTGNLFTRRQRSLTMPTATTESLLWFLGLYLGDGFLRRPHAGAKRTIVDLAIPVTDQPTREKLQRVLRDAFGYELRFDRDPMRARVHAKPIAELIAHLGLAGFAKTKQLPGWLFTLPRSQKLAFIAGYADADGYLRSNAKQQDVVLTSANRALLRDVQRLGITAGLHVSDVYEFHSKQTYRGTTSIRTGYRLLINGDASDLAAESVRCAGKWTPRRYVHRYASAHKSPIDAHISQELGFAKIQFIKPLGIEPVYDIEVDGPHNFVAEGIIVHNSEVVYHSIREDLTKQGVIFTDMDTAVREHPALVQQYFATIIPPGDNKFAALNSAVWSGGSFIYVPKGVNVEIPLQAYFRINAENMGQFERTLIIADEGASVHYIEGCTAPVYSTDSLHSAVVELIARPHAKIRYTTIQNWSKNVYNLVTKRAVAYEGATVEWIDGNLGSKLTMKYPAIYLLGEHARGEVLSVAFSGKDQHQDAGAKIIHVAPNTTSTITSKSISKDGGRTTYRGLVKVYKGATGAKSHVRCDALLLDERSRSDTYPTMEIDEEQAEIGHEASVSKIGEEQLFYLMSRGLKEHEAATMIVNGFFEPFAKALPLEYAVELNRLIQLEMEGSVG